jgi:oxygen-independent coproporphyrinogen-3 oxidase
VSKRQVLISENDLPGSEDRFVLSELAQNFYTAAGYGAIGIDHFAMCHDGLAQANDEGTLRRNFQGYTDDTSNVLIGLGASAISKFAQGYTQNAVATSAYQERVLGTGLAGHRGFAVSDLDLAKAKIIEQILSNFVFDRKQMTKDFPAQKTEIDASFREICKRYVDVIEVSAERLSIRPAYRALARIIAHSVDSFSISEQGHSKAI